METSKQSLNPFPGLRPFEFHESNLFFGREEQSKELLHKLRMNRFVAVVGTSGSGKSSLVRAGLLPLLGQGLLRKPSPSWRIAVLRPGKDPLMNLAQALNSSQAFGSNPEVEPELTFRLAGQEGNGASDEKIIKTAATETILRRSARGLVEHVRRTRIPKNESLLLIVDQFEELFRFKEKSDSPKPEDEAAAFAKLLLEAVHEKELPIYIVLTMRSDFLGDCAQFRDLPEAINESQYLIPRMTRDQQRSAIVSPANAYGAQMAPRLVQRLLNDVDDNPDHLPTLQHALMRTWDHWKGNGADREIDLQHYEAIGTMSQALSRHADEAYKELPDARAREIAEKLFKALTVRVEHSREIRRPTRLRDICQIANAETTEVIAVIENFRRDTRSFLMPLPSVELTDESLIDISHESLIQGWEKLKKWVDEEARSARVYKFVADAAERYKDNQASPLRAADLKFALEWRDKTEPNEVWASRYHPGLQQVLDYIKASEVQRDKDLAKEERLKQKQLESERQQHATAQALEEARRLQAEEAARRAEAETASAKEAKRAAEIEARSAQREYEDAVRLAEEQKLIVMLQRKSARRLRIAVVALIIAFLFAGAAATYAFIKKNEADKEKNNARNAQAIAETERRKAEESKEAAIVSQENEKRAALEAQEQASKATAALNIADQERARADEQSRLAQLGEQKAIEAQGATKKALSDAIESKNDEITAREAAEKINQREDSNREALLALQMGELDGPEGAEGKFKAIFDAYKDDQEPDGRSWVMYNLGATYREKSDYTKAQEAYDSSIKMLEESYGLEAQKTLPSRDRLAHLYQEQGKYNDAEKNYESVLKLLSSSSSRSSEVYRLRIKTDVADLYNTQAADIGTRINQQAREIDEAIKSLALARELDDAQDNFGPEHRPVDNEKPKSGLTAQQAPPPPKPINRTIQEIDAYCAKPDTKFNKLCQQYSDLKSAQSKKFEQAKTYYEEVLSISENNLPPNHPNLAKLYSSLGQLSQQQDRPSRRPLFVSLEETIRRLNKASSDFDKWDLKARLELARALAYANRLDRAERLYLSISDSLEKNPPKALAEAMGAYIEIARFYNRRKDYDKAEKYYLDALEKNPPGASAEAKSAYLEIARFYEKKQDYDKAEKYYLDTLEKNPPGASADVHLEIARFYNRRKDYDKAEKYYKDAIPIKNAIRNPDDYDLPYSFYDSLDYELGRFYIGRKNYAAAKTHYANIVREQKEKAKTKPTKQNQYYFAIALNLLADLHQANGKSAEALDSSKEAVTVMTAATDQNDPLLSAFLYKMAEINHKQKNLSAAESYYIRAQKRMQPLIAKVKQAPSDLTRIMEGKLGDSNGVTLSTEDLTENLIGLASLYSDQKRPLDAERLYKEALDTLGWIDKAITVDNRGFLSDYYKRETYSMYVKSLMGYADFLRTAGRQKEAIEHEKRADEFKALLKAMPDYQDEDI